MIQVKGKMDPKGIEEKLIELLRNTKMDQRAHNTKLHQIMSCTDERVISSYPLPVICIQSLKFPTKAGKLDQV